MRHCTAAALLSFCCACSTAAKLQVAERSTARTVEGRIIDSNVHGLWVRNEATGSVEAVPRTRVLAIDHPGDGAAITGTVLSALGLVAIGAGAGLIACAQDNDCDTSYGSPMFGFGLMLNVLGGGMVLPGIPIAASGWDRWLSSKERARAPKTH